nr:IS110 family transposase [Acidimicrobiia bacterium]MBA3955944.1 IS110 family transposase [Acidimicrobiia bacterium]
MEVLIERCAGLDVHKDVVVACVRVWSSDGERVSQVEEFATYTDDLLALRDWLSAHGVTRVGMEA